MENLMEQWHVLSHEVIKLRRYLFFFFFFHFQDALLKISRTEGIMSLWSGLSPTLVLAIPATVAYFVSYEQLRLYLKVKISLIC
jgi:hypothetical protein